MRKHLGKLPARHDPRVPTVHRLLGGAKLPSPNLDAKWQGKVAAYGMLLNDQMGDCAVASALHQVQTWTANANKQEVPDADCALRIYEQQTGYNPITGANDTGINLQDFFQSWMKTPLPVNHVGRPAPLAGYAQIDIADLSTLRGCIWQFGGVALGVALPTDAEAAFDAGQPWSDTTAGIEGGHAIYGVGCDDDWLYAVTWGKVQKISWPWWLKYGDEAFALISADWLASDRTPSGLDLAQLQSELDALKARLAA